MRPLQTKFVLYETQGDVDDGSHPSMLHGRICPEETLG